jgi:GT2 family glycosyltransferase
MDCVDGLDRHLDHTRHRVLFVNDCGPDVDLIERWLLERVESRANFEYFRNERNLGFVGTCNRAVMELDDSHDDVLLLNSDAVPTAGFLEAMLEVLDIPSTGVVTARSNNATIASIPYRLTNRNAARTPERTISVWTALVPYLPLSQIMPVAMGFCFLTRRDLIQKYGLFDEAFAPGYGEENDYCLRIAQHGWSARIANRALVLHAGSKSFTGNRNALRAAHQRELERRYPFLPDAVAAYQRQGMPAAERFADVLVTAGARHRISLDARRAPAPGALIDAFADAFHSEQYILEARVAPGSALQSDRVVVSDAEQNPDDLVTATLIVDPTPSSLVSASRRGELIVALRSTSTETPWSVESIRAGAAVVAPLVDQYCSATFPLASDTTLDLAAVEATIANALEADVKTRVATVSRRWSAILPLELAAAEASSTVGAEARLVAELEGLRNSRAFRLSSRITQVASRFRLRR